MRPAIEGGFDDAATSEPVPSLLASMRPAIEGGFDKARLGEWAQTWIELQ